MRRLTVVADSEIEQWLEREFVELGATGYTSLPCSGAGRRDLANGITTSVPKCRIEVVVPPPTCERILSFLRHSVLPEHHVTACIENVDVVRRDHFDVLTEEKHATPL